MAYLFDYGNPDLQNINEQMGDIVKIGKISSIDPNTNTARVTFPDRDDLVSGFFVPDATVNKLGFSVSDKNIVLCDDVLHTGRSAVAGIEALFRLGRPAKIQLLVLVDRGGREVPVRADYVGKNVPTSREEYIKVQFRELGHGEDALTITRR